MLPDEVSADPQGFPPSLLPMNAWSMVRLPSLILHQVRPDEFFDPTRFRWTSPDLKVGSPESSARRSRWATTRLPAWRIFAWWSGRISRTCSFLHHRSMRIRQPAQEDGAIPAPASADPK